MISSVIGLRDVPRSYPMDLRNRRSYPRDRYSSESFWAHSVLPPTPSTTPSTRRHRRGDVLCCNMCSYFFPFLALAFFWTPPRIVHFPKPSQVSSSISGGTLHFSLPL